MAEHNIAQSQGQASPATPEEFFAALCQNDPNVLFLRIKGPLKLTWPRAMPWPQVLPHALQYSRDGWDTYFTVGEMVEGATSRKREDMKEGGARSIYTDHDDVETAGAAIERWEAGPCPPSAVIETSDGKRQAHWFLEPGLDWDLWRHYQRCLISQTNDALAPRLINGGGLPRLDAKGHPILAADPSIIDAPRIMRVPGSVHNKGAPFQGRIVSFTGRRYSLAEIAAWLPAPVPKAPRREGSYLDDGSYPTQFTELLNTLEILDEHDDGSWTVVCPNAAEHSNEDPAARLYAPSDENEHQGGFHCFHAHCKARLGQEKQIGSLYRWVETGSFTKVVREALAPASAEEFDELPGPEVVDLSDCPEWVPPLDLSDCLPDAAFPPPFPGFMADAVQACLVVSPISQPEMATGAALAGMSACLPQRYNHGGLRGNLYTLLVAGTGAGKDKPMALAELLARTYGSQVIDMPGSIQGLERMVHSAATGNPPTSVLLSADEVAFMLAAVHDKRAPSAVQAIAGGLLKLYSRSGGTYSSSARAEASNSRGDIENPYLSMLGTSTPEKLGGALTGDSVDSGLAGRCLLVLGRPRPAAPPYQRHRNIRLPASVLERIRELSAARAGFPDITGGEEAPLDDSSIEMALEAEALLEEAHYAFSREAHHAPTAAGKAVRLRSLEQTLRICVVLAVWYARGAPLITADMVRWAVQWVRACNAAMVQYLGEYAHDSELQAEALGLLKTLKRLLSGELKMIGSPQTLARMRELGMVNRQSLLLHGRFDTPKSLDDALLWLELKSKILRGSVDVISGNGTPKTVPCFKLHLED